MNAIRGGGSHGTRTSRARSVFLLAVFLASFLAAAGPGIAGDLKIIGGYVERVSGHYVFLHGRSYDIEGAPVTDPLGKRLSADQIVRGNKIDLFYRRGALISVLVYESLPE